MMAAMTSHDRLLRQAVLECGGHVIKMAGDGIHAAFGDAVGAVRAALAIQRALRDPQATDGIRLRVRCGLHTGPAEERDGDFYGPAVNRAARLANAASAGQVILSGTVHASVAGRLPEGVFLRSLGVVRLRDLSRAEPVFQLTHAELPADFPPLRSLASNPNNLPNLLTSFVGRHKELRDIDRLFESARLVSIVGAGGIGKTRLALQCAAWRLDRYEDGVWFVDLAAIGDAALLVATVARAIGVRNPPMASALDALIDYARPRRLLVVLDNCEHLLDACARFADALLRAAPSVHVLATTREGLEVDGEAACRIPPLPIPDPDVAASFHDLLGIESVQLLVERAMLHRPDLVLDTAQGPALARICFRLDGIPLALELAAARLRESTLEEVDRSLSDRFGYLVTGSRVAPPRQKTLGAMVDWSWRLLDEREQGVFARLGVFDGTFGPASARALCPDLPPDEVDEAVKRLARKSLVVEVEDGRHRLLETLRDFALAQLGERGEREAVEALHAAHFRERALSRRTRLLGDDRGAAVAELDPDLDNLRAALAWHEARDAPELAELLRAMGAYWSYAGGLGEGRAHLQAFVERGNPGPADAVWGDVVYTAAVLAYRQCDLEAAEGLARKALAVREALGLRHAAGAALSLVAIAVFVRRGAEASEPLLLEAIEHMDPEAGHRVGHYFNLAQQWVFAGEVARGRGYAEKARALPQGSSPHNRMRYEGFAGWEALVEGDLEAAVVHMRDQVGLAIACGDRLNEAMARMTHALALVAAARPGEAVGEFALALHMLESQGATLELVNALEAFAAWLAASGEPEDAVRLCATTLKVRERIGFPVGCQARRVRGLALDGVALDPARRTALEREGHAASFEDAVAAALVRARAGS